MMQVTMVTSIQPMTRHNVTGIIWTLSYPGHFFLQHGSILQSLALGSSIPCNFANMELMYSVTVANSCRYVFMVFQNV